MACRSIKAKAMTTLKLQSTLPKRLQFFSSIVASWNQWNDVNATRLSSLTLSFSLMAVNQSALNLAFVSDVSERSRSFRSRSCFDCDIALCSAPMSFGFDTVQSEIVYHCDISLLFAKHVIAFYMNAKNIMYSCIKVVNHCVWSIHTHVHVIMHNHAYFSILGISPTINRIDTLADRDLV